MNREPFGEKCFCGHLESQHFATKPSFKIPDIPLDIGMYFPHPNISVVKRTSCKLCNCNQFDSKEKNSNFWRGLSS